MYFQEFTGNTDGNSIVKQFFSRILQTRFIRFIPWTWNKYTSSGNTLFIALRTELYICNAGEYFRVFFVVTVFLLVMTMKVKSR